MQTSIRIMWIGIVLGLLSTQAYAQAYSSLILNECSGCSFKIKLKEEIKGGNVVITDMQTFEQVKAFSIDLPKKFYLPVNYLKKGYYSVAIERKGYLIYEKLFYVKR